MKPSKWPFGFYVVLIHQTRDFSEYCMPTNSPIRAWSNIYLIHYIIFGDRTTKDGIRASFGMHCPGILTTDPLPWFWPWAKFIRSILSSGLLQSQSSRISHLPLCPPPSSVRLTSSEKTPPNLPPSTLRSQTKNPLTRRSYLWYMLNSIHGTYAMFGIATSLEITGIFILYSIS